MFIIVQCLKKSFKILILPERRTVLVAMRSYDRLCLSSSPSIILNSTHTHCFTK